MSNRWWLGLAAVAILAQVVLDGAASWPARLVLCGLALAALARVGWTRRERREVPELPEPRDVVAHDIGNLLALVHLNATAISGEGGDEDEEALDDLQLASRTACRMFESWRGRDGVGEPASAGALLEAFSRLVSTTGVTVDTTVLDELTYDGAEGDAARVIQNLLLNAVREAVVAGEPRVRVEMDADAVRFTNIVRHPGELDEVIYMDGVSRSGSSGRGLTIAVSAAHRIGWQIHHEVAGDHVTFSCRRTHRVPTPLGTPRGAVAG